MNESEKMQQKVLESLTETFAGVLVRNLSRKTVIELFTKRLNATELSAVTDKSKSFCSMVKNGKRIWSEDAKEAIMKFYTKVSEIPCEDSTQEIDGRKLYIANDVQRLLREYRLMFSEMDFKMSQFKMKTKMILKEIEKSAPRELPKSIDTKANLGEKNESETEKPMTLNEKMKQRQESMNKKE